VKEIEGECERHKVGNGERVVCASECACVHVCVCALAYPRV